MSDEPPSYFVNGVELMGFRRELNLQAPGEVMPGRKKKNRNKSRGPVKRSFLIKRDGMDCHYCDCKMIMPKGAFDGGPNAVSVEHIVPQSADGSDEVYNLVLACKKCNNGFGSEMFKCDCDFCKEARRIHGAQNFV